jgi:hypothetical protein
LVVAHLLLGMQRDLPRLVMAVTITEIMAAVVGMEGKTVTAVMMRVIPVTVTEEEVVGEEGVEERV